MNITLSAAPLPDCLDHPQTANQARRDRIGDFQLTSSAVDRFNRVLERIGVPHPAYDSDRLVTAARFLQASAAASKVPPCIQQRLLRARVAVSMLADRQWAAADETVEIGRLVVEYVSANDALIPSTIPIVGRLDDAIVIEAGWPRLSAEIVDYVDFRRLRRLAFPDRLCRAVFDRDAWRQAQADEAALKVHRRSVYQHHYGFQPSSMFRVS